MENLPPPPPSYREMPPPATDQKKRLGPKVAVAVLVVVLAIGWIASAVNGKPAPNRDGGPGTGATSVIPDIGDPAPAGEGGGDPMVSAEMIVEFMPKKALKMLCTGYELMGRDRDATLEAFAEGYGNDPTLPPAEDVLDEILTQC